MLPSTTSHVNSCAEDSSGLFLFPAECVFSFVTQVQTLSATTPGATTSTSKQPQRIRKRTKVLSIARKYVPRSHTLGSSGLVCT